LLTQHQRHCNWWPHNYCKYNTNVIRSYRRALS